MKRISLPLLVFLPLQISLGAAWAAASPLVVDHTYNFSEVPDSVWTQLRTNSPIIHYAHRSDGSAVPFGLDSLARAYPSQFPFSSEDQGVPTATEGLRFWNGMSSNTYIYPDQYWGTTSGTNDLGSILSTHPEIQYTSWTWCNEDDYWTLQELQKYFQTMDSLEQAFPNVIFIYQTAAMRSAGSDDGDINQAQFNDSLRSWAVKNNKVLFDFADLDVWYNGSKNMETRQIGATDTLVPFQNPAWQEGNGPTNNGHHANDAMGVDKGKAWLVLMARLAANWNPSGSTTAIKSPKALQPQGLSAQSQYNLLGQRQKAILPNHH